MPVSYNFGQKAKYRITLELDVMDDFNPHQIDWEKVLDVQGSEKISAYVEDLSTPDVWQSSRLVTEILVAQIP